MVPDGLLSRRGQVHVLAAVALGYVAVGLAVSPVSVSMPRIATSLGVDVAEASLVMVAYLVTLTALLLPAGRAGDLYGYRPVYIAGLIITTVAAIAAGLVSELPALVLVRAVQGAGAAFVSGTALAVLTTTFPASERGRIVAVAAVAAAVGAGSGTLVTPYVLDAVGWPGVFLIAVPVGLAALVFAIRMPIPRVARGPGRLDLLGTILLIGGLFALSLSFDHFHDGPRTYAAGWSFHLGMVLLAFGAFAAFVAVERRVAHPLVELRYLRDRRFGSAATANGIFHMTMMAVTFLTPFLFEGAWGLTTTASSLVVVVMNSVNIVFALLAGWLIDRFRVRWLPVVSLAGIAAGMLAFGLLGSALTFPLYVGLIVLLGVSSGVFNTANNTAIMSILPGDARGFSSGMLETTRQFGHAIAVSLAVLAFGLAGATLQGESSPSSMLAGFQLAEIVMGSIAAVGVVFAWRGQVSGEPQSGDSQVPGATVHDIGAGVGAGVGAGSGTVREPAPAPVISPG